MTHGLTVLVVGSGGREHALALALSADPQVTKLYVAPGNPGTAQCGENVAVDVSDHAAVTAFCRLQGIDLVVVGPEGPLVAGIADDLRQAGFKVFGRRRETQLMGGRRWDTIYMDALASEFTSPVLAAIFAPDVPRS